MNDRQSRDLEELEALMAIAREYDLDAMLVEEGSFRVELVRREALPVMQAPAAPVQSGPPVSPVAVSEVAAPAPVPGGETVTAPIVGVFYRAPAPSAPSFVAIGDRVTVGQTLCILEAMKLMNEITTDISGIVAAAYPENGDLVTIGQPLFHIQPAP